MPDFGTWPLWSNALAFLVSGVAVWFAGSRLAGYVDALADRLGIGQGIAGLVILGGITSLPEVAVSVSSAIGGEPVMAVSTLLGSVAVQVIILAVADVVIGRDALTSVLTNPVVLLQGTFGFLLLAVVAIAITAGEVAVGPVGLWSTAILVAYLGCVALLANSEKNPPGWTARHTAGQEDAEDDTAGNNENSVGKLLAMTAGAAAVILVAGWALSESGAAAAKQTGLGTAFFGATLLAIATSLPEISTVVASVRLRRYEMALGDIFGTNLFNLTLIFVIDLAASGPPVLAQAGPFSVTGALLGLVLTGIFLAGIIERRDRTVFHMGWDSLAALACYGAGVALLFSLRDAAGG